MKKEKLLQVKDLSKSFVVEKNFFGFPKKTVEAVSQVNFDVFKGETLGLVGESGCGKTTVGRTMIGLYKPTQGRVIFEKQDVHQELEGKEKYKFRRKLQMIFQDPYSSLNPRITVGEIVAEPMDIFKTVAGKERQIKVQKLLDKVGLNPEHANRFPHEFSGGQRQRIGIARALATEPDFIVCDEPISALDVSIQAQIVNLLKKLQKEMGLTYLFVAHDLSMVRHISHRVAVMYLGTLVEIADCETIYEKSLHPYTQALLSAIPIPDPLIEKQRRRILMTGEVPSPLNPPKGCRFRTRCPKATKECSEKIPLLKAVSDGHQVACHKI